MDLRTWLLDEIDTHRFQYAITAGMVPKDRWHERPRPGDNSVAWLVWHIARWNDISVNAELRGGPVVLGDEWTRRLGVGPQPGTGMTDDDVDALSSAIDPEQLEAYFHAVLDDLEGWMKGLDDDALDAVLAREIDSDAFWDANPELLPEAAAWVRDFGRGATGARLLRWGYVGHTYWHLGELQSVTTALGYRTG